ncbi:hypothetical protein [Streptomyces sp. NPDC019224]
MIDNAAEKTIDTAAQAAELQALEQDLDVEITLEVAESSFSYSEARVF